MPKAHRSSTASAPDFNDTEIAFRSRSTAAIRKAKVLFQSFSYPALISAGPKLLRFAYALRLPVDPLIRMTIFEQFCGGETIADCDGTVARLAQSGVRSVLDYSVEGLGREVDFDETVAETLRVLAQARTSPAIPFAVFKGTGVGKASILAKASAGAELTPDEAAALARTQARVHTLCVAARDAGRRILIDAEESWLQPALDTMALAAMRVCNRDRAVVYTTLQLYRHDRLAYLRELHQLGVQGGFQPGIKLVRGAYMEKERARAAALGLPSPIQPDKAATDRDFDLALAFCVERLGELALFAGTHNELSTRRLVQLLERRGLSRDDARAEFSQLLGMGDNLTFNLADAGYNVSKYVPYGPVRAVIPYLVRRAEENSAIKGQAGRELALIEQELRRRAAAP